MKRFIAAAFTLVGLVFTVGCIGAPESEGAGGNGVADDVPALEEQQAKPCRFPPKMPICPPYSTLKCEFDPVNCGGGCQCVAY